MPPKKSPAAKQGRKRLLFIIPIIVIIIGAAVFMLLPANVSRGEAADIALAYVGGGTANRPDRDFERIQRVWAVEVFYGGLVHEVYVSMRTGAIVAVEVDRWD
jgi:flagellar basal body-associated protein FliL